MEDFEEVHGGSAIEEVVDGFELRGMRLQLQDLQGRTRHLIRWYLSLAYAILVKPSRANALIWIHKIVFHKKEQRLLTCWTNSST